MPESLAGRMLRIDATSAENLKNAIEQQTALLLPQVHKVTLNAGKRIRKSAREGWPYSGRTKHFKRSFTTKTRKLAKGTTVEIYSRSPFGTIFSYGARGFVGKDVLYEALDQHYSWWQGQLADVLEQTIKGNPNPAGSTTSDVGVADGGD